MARAPYCKILIKTCRNPACRRPFVVVVAPGTRCKECRRCHRDGYCSLRCRIEGGGATGLSKR